MYCFKVTTGLQYIRYGVVEGVRSLDRGLSCT